NHYDDFLLSQNEIFKVRRDKFTAKLNAVGIPFEPMNGGIFLWLKTPKHYDGETFETYLLKEKSILVAPGVPFGEHGRHYVRIS
ncbi:aminotransferase class I/II-fold pyridoxal phosphate-dependent enzyme, partial [Staphylococcus aureus]|nr:aminotransferase class I/II-fold pyridoxal phosphate-dependent enzyme [Staphylococcus aureus]